MARTISIGAQGFEELRANGYFYVDKTAVIADLVDRRGVTLFCRLGRFGKSLILRMLQSFFEVPAEGFVPDRAGLFDGLAVMGAEERHVAQRAAHPVVYLGLNRCRGDIWDACRAAVARVMSDEYVRHAYLLDSPRTMRFERDRFERICSGTASEDEVEGSLEFLAKLLARADEDANERLNALAGGGTVPAPLDLSIVYGQMDSEPDAAHEADLPALVLEAKFEADAPPERLRALAEGAMAGQALPRRYPTASRAAAPCSGQWPSTPTSTWPSSARDTGRTPSPVGCSA